jgi:3-isopropylmalate/(R)-2-methylmalate dehydratase small subunit
METQLKGKAWVFGDSIDTDMITPGKYLTIIDEKGLAEHLLEGADPEFPKKVGRGDIIVGGENFGCGSSREHAVIAMKGAGVSVVLAESFARIFYRNAINVGLPAMECAGVGKETKEGDVLEIDLGTGDIKNTRSGKSFKAVPLSDKALEILEAGGLVNVVRERLSKTANHRPVTATPYAKHADSKED